MEMSFFISYLVFPRAPHCRSVQDPEQIAWRKNVVAPGFADPEQASRFHDSVRRDTGFLRGFPCGFHFPSH
jgi:hypothetical protein